MVEVLLVMFFSYAQNTGAEKYSPMSMSETVMVTGLVGMVGLVRFVGVVAWLDLEA